MLIIGEVVGVHGLKGDIKIYPHTDFPQRFNQLERVQIRRGNLTKDFHVEKVRQHKNIFILKFREVNDRNQAEELRGWELVVEYDQAVDLPQGHYFDYQLEGLEVLDLNTDSVVGKISQILHLPANAVYKVDKVGGGVCYIPALKSVVKKVDLDQGRMEIIPLEGMLE